MTSKRARSWIDVPTTEHQDWSDQPNYREFRTLKELRNFVNKNKAGMAEIDVEHCKTREFPWRVYYLPAPPSPDRKGE